MEPKKFCELCDFGSGGTNYCPVAEFYSKKGFCPVASVVGLPASLDCFSVHFSKTSYSRETRLKEAFTELAGTSKLETLQLTGINF